MEWPCKDYNFQTCLRDNLVLRMLEMAFQSLQISKFYGGACPQTPLVHTVDYSSLTSCLLQILLKPLSRKVMWLETCQSNNLSYAPGKLYLECVQEHRGCLLLVCCDYGSKNGIIAGIQCFFHFDNEPFSGELAHRYGSSTRN